jgi:hypothetical protein
LADQSPWSIVAVIAYLFYCGANSIESVERVAIFRRGSLEDYVRRFQRALTNLGRGSVALASSRCSYILAFALGTPPLRCVDRLRFPTDTV